MSRCLSADALARAAAELATDDERAHLATCQVCGARRERLAGDLAQIALTLKATPEPARRRGAARRRWSAIALASALAAGTLLWIEVTAWRVVHRLPDTAQAEEAAGLSDVSITLFSVEGDAARADEDDEMLEPEAVEQDSPDGGGPS